MKKFISMVMAAAMVVSLVPATAFAYELESTAKVLDAAEMTEKQAKVAKESGIDALASQNVDQPELQLKIKDADYTADETLEYELTVELDGAEWESWNDTDGAESASVVLKVDRDGDKTYTLAPTFSDVDKNEATMKFTVSKELVADDKIIVDLSQVKVTKTSAGAEATVSVDSDDLGVKADALVFAVVQDNVLKAKVKDTVDVAEEELVVLKEITIEAATGYLPSGINKTVENSDGDDKEYDLKLKLSKGFEFDTDACEDINVPYVFRVVAVDGDTAYVNVVGDQAKIKINGLKIEATTAKAGDIATLTVSATDWDKASIEVAKVVGEGLTIEVDEDEDVPEMWSGVAVGTDYLTDDVENEALKIKIKETVAGAYNEKDEVELVMPEGVWVVDATATEVEGEYDENEGNNWQALLAAAYKEGDHQSFVFKKRTIDETTTEAFEFDVDLVLAADPGFVGDVEVELLVDGESAGTVTIATFKTPMVVEAQANDLIIDYRNTEVPTDIVVKEAEAGLWAKGLAIGFGIDKFDADCFEDDMVYTVNEDESGMEIDGEDDYLYFEVDEESDDEAAVVTISNISLYMQRNIPAGSYDLTMYGGVFKQYNEQRLFAADEAECLLHDELNNNGTVKNEANHNDEKECFIDDVCDYSDVVKEGFVNVVTAGRDADDASFTTKVVVPVGEAYIIAGEQTVALDVPAYVSAAGYTMLPVRAVAVALGILNNNVLWDQATKTVTILYGQRIITMQVGAKVVYVNGSAIPASASPEVVDGRTFLPMRDLATALGVTDITWDAATKTATLNGNK